MSDKAHVIEIDRIVLSETEHSVPNGLRSLIEGAAQRALRDAGMGVDQADPVSTGRVAGEVAGAVLHAVEGRRGIKA